MKTTTLITAGLLVGLGAAAPLHAKVVKQQDDDTVRTATTAPTLTGSLAQASHLLGLDVRDADGRPAASLHDLVITPDGGLLAALLVTDDGGRVVLPPDLLRLPEAPSLSDDAHIGQRLAEGDRATLLEPAFLTMPLSAETIAEAPRLAPVKNGAPELGELKEAFAYFDRDLQLSAWESDGPDGLAVPRALDELEVEPLDDRDASSDEQPALFSATTLMGAEVTNQAAERLGAVSDLAVSLGRERVLYAVLQRLDPEMLAEQRFAIPMGALQQHDSEAGTLILEVSAARLDTADGFEQWPRSADTALLAPAEEGALEPLAIDELDGVDGDVRDNH